jgi:20S proteasome subunit beta 7
VNSCAVVVVVVDVVVVVVDVVVLVVVLVVVVDVVEDVVLVVVLVVVEVVVLVVVLVVVVDVVEDVVLVVCLWWWWTLSRTSCWSWCLLSGGRRARGRCRGRDRDGLEAGARQPVVAQRQVVVRQPRSPRPVVSVPTRASRRTQDCICQAA